MLIRLTMVTVAAIIGGMMVFGTGGNTVAVEDVAEKVLTPSVEQTPEPEPGTADVAVAPGGDKSEVFAEPATSETELTEAPEPNVEVAKQGGLEVTAVLPASMQIDVSMMDALTDRRASNKLRPAAPGPKIVYVTGTRVNLRAGPSTANPVVDQLVQGTEAEVLDEVGDGWLQIRTVATGVEGFMSGDFLSAEQPG